MQAGPTRIVQHAIDTIVNANFPERAGVYKAVMWKDRGELVAATGLGVSIHISTSLYMALTWDQLVAVMAHELAHQEANHVLIGLGASAAIWVVDKATWFITPWMILSPADELLNAELERNQEIEADLLAVKYLKNAGYTKEDYLALLNWIKTEVDGGGGCRVLCDHPHIDDRIKAVRERAGMCFTKILPEPLIRLQTKSYIWGYITGIGNNSGGVAVGSI